MSKGKADSARDKLIAAGSLLFRKQGYVATTVDAICTAAGVTKGAFFHHFQSKEHLGEMCLQQWDQFGATIDQGACLDAVDDPAHKVVAFMEYIIDLFADPTLLKSCLAGTIAQEVSETNSTLRCAAHICFANAESRFKVLLDEACKSKGVELDTVSLASLWIATMQGSLILCKASQDESVLAKNLKHVKDYITARLNAKIDTKHSRRSQRKKGKR